MTGKTPEVRFRHALRRVIDELAVAVEPDALDRMERHYELLLKWAPKVNLTTVLDPEAAAVRHFGDSLTFMTVLPEKTAVVDVGSGAGFPGLVLASAAQRPVTLVEPIRKRVSFLRVVASALELPQLRIVEGRLETRDRTGVLPSDQTVVSRATFPPEEWLRRVDEALLPGGYLVLSWGRGAWSATELGERAKAADLSPVCRRRLVLPGGDQRTLDLLRRDDLLGPATDR